MIDLRIARLRRTFGLSQPMAATLAALIYGGQAK